MRYLLIIAFVALHSSSFAQVPDTLWTSTFGGSGDDRCFYGFQTVDDGYLLVGYTESYGAGGDDIWVVKTSSSGAFEWYECYGGTGEDRGHTALQTLDGGYIYGGYTTSSGAGLLDAWLIRVDENLALEWENTYGGSGNDRAMCIIQTTDGGYAFCGYTSSSGAGQNDMWLVKTDSNGNVEWDKTFGGSYQDHGQRVIQTSDGGYALTGATQNTGGDWDILIIKTDASGSIVWESSPGDSGDDYAWAIVETLDGGYLVTGRTTSSGAGGDDLWIVKTDNTCAVEWDVTFGGTGNEYGRSITAFPDTTYVISGWTSSWGSGGNDALLIKVNSVGSLIWDLFIGSTGDEVSQEAMSTSDGGFALFGYTDSWGSGIRDYWLIKTAPETGIEGGAAAPEVMQLHTHPNPFNSRLHVTYDLPFISDVNLAVYDLAGRQAICIESLAASAGSHSVSLDTESLPSGCYQVVLGIADAQATSRCVKID